MDRIKEVGGRVGALGTAVGTMFVLGVIMAGSSSAAPADPVEAAFTAMQGKVTTYGAALAALTVLAVGILLGLAWLKKSRSA